MSRLAAALLGALILSGCSPTDRPAPVVIVPAAPLRAPTPKPVEPVPAPESTPLPPALLPAANPTCVLRSESIDLASWIPLRIAGSGAFLHVGDAAEVEVRIASPYSTARAVRGDMEVIGHVALDEIPVALREDALVDGWIRIKRGVLLRGDATGFDVQVELPWAVAARVPPRVHAACDGLTLARSSTEVADLPLEKGVGLRPGDHALRVKPGGPVVATIRVPKRTSGEAMPFLDVTQVAQRGPQVRIRVSGNDADVEGWVARSAIAPPDDMFGGLGVGRLPAGAITLTTSAPLIASVGDRKLLVGTARAGTFECRPREGARAGDDVELDFEVDAFSGAPAGEAAVAKLFVRPAAGEICGPPAPKR